MDFEHFRAITFDCYGTLIAWEDGIFSALEPILRDHGKTLSDPELLELYGELEAEAEKGEFQPYREVLAAVVKGFGKRLGFTPSEREVCSLAESIKDWQPFPDTAAALRKLQRRFQLAIISNIDDDLFAGTLPKLQVKFDQVVTAQQARAYKPSLRNFHLALDRLGLAPEQVLHVGQSVYHDVIPAKSLGMGTVWVRRPSRRPGVGAVKAAAGNPDLEIRDLATLAAMAAGTQPA
jgi:2-haloacid dehalogenase